MSTADLSPTSPVARPRFAFIDLARGIALLAMFVFHFTYDLAYFELIDVDTPVEPGWHWFARSIAASFLTLVGVSLVLATRNGLNRQVYLNRHAYLKRLAMVAGAAALVTVGTWFAMPDSFIFFGILHQVALASVVALPFLRLPTLVIALAALFVFAVPYLAAPYLTAHPVLDQSWLLWLGLAQEVPASADFVPVFPWFGWVLTGIALARLTLPRLAQSRLAGWRPHTLPARVVAWGGRNSLLVYLVHQPVFIGALMLATQFAIARPADEQPFMQSCERSCMQGAHDAGACRMLCGCTVDAIKREDLWRKLLENALSPEERSRVSALAKVCFR
ncbi:heparan-alpha-glucosaminide N-acetyltransferase [Bosea sp. 685]|uniref:DUF1624 domain-containing protein n=1 Tax=Bosea sp. 685 TaxID=3080057 RepID=UPI0028934965|nr:heparan-alpha-glucosaminide N-acetyltransferase [Bosea sp. 685]WNJ92705.1 heparan-alpha-glucosaminide N-acetyltransferase [Bosea sp. 685]